ncbi:lipocalin family protein [Hyphomonas sp.]|uniref:lipocalin family protein n=1 Tax=Hyphomonas sp. TaxID=87 RepID=UPI00391B5B8B
MRFIFAAAFALPLLTACISQPDYRNNPEPPPTVASVDIDRYAGRWFEIARYPNWFQRNCGPSEAIYARREDGRISVLNSCETEDGGTDDIEGSARILDGSGNAKLKVRFAPGWIPFAEGDYWVLHLEPDYSAVLVGEPRGQYLWILAREADPDPDIINRILARAQALGYQTAPLEWPRGRPG